MSEQFSPYKSNRNKTCITGQTRASFCTITLPHSLWIKVCCLEIPFKDSFFFEGEPKFAKLRFVLITKKTLYNKPCLF